MGRRELGWRERESDGGRGLKVGKKDEAREGAREGWKREE